MRGEREQLCLDKAKENFKGAYLYGVSSEDREFLNYFF